MIQGPGNQQVALQGQSISTLRHNFFFPFGATAPPQWARAPSFTKFLDHTQRRATVGRTPLDE